MTFLSSSLLLAVGLPKPFSRRLFLKSKLIGHSHMCEAHEVRRETDRARSRTPLVAYTAMVESKSCFQLDPPEILTQIKNQSSE